MYWSWVCGKQKRDFENNVDLLPFLDREGSCCLSPLTDQTRSLNTPMLCWKLFQWEDVTWLCTALAHTDWLYYKVNVPLSRLLLSAWVWQPNEDSVMSEYKWKWLQHGLTCDLSGSGYPPYGWPNLPWRNSNTDFGKESSSALATTSSSSNLFDTINCAKSPTTLDDGVT